MTVHAISNASIGPGSERPPADNPTGGVSTIPFGLFIDSDTGTVYETTGEQWVQIGQLPAGISLPGVTSDGTGGMVVGGNVTITGGLGLGDVGLASDLVPSFHEIRGRTSFIDVLGNYVDGDTVVEIDQGRAVPVGIIGGVSALAVYRSGDISAADYDAPALNFRDNTASAQNTLNVYKGAGTGKALSVTGPAAFSGVIGEHGKAPATTPATITGNVTTGTLANLQDVVGQLLTALDAKGSIVESTT